MRRTGFKKPTGIPKIRKVDFFTKPRKPMKRGKLRNMKARVWKCTTADHKFSLYIRSRDGKCLRCGTINNLTNSHYWRRGHSGTRFEPDNCITLCMPCHSEWENLKNYEYKEFMLMRLGEGRYLEVEKMARTFKNRQEAIQDWMKLYYELNGNQINLEFAVS